MLTDHERTQVEWGASLLQKFIVFAVKSGTLLQEQKESAQKGLTDLSDSIRDETQTKEIETKLNYLIDEINTHMRENSPPIKYAPFPQFSLVTKDQKRSALLDQLDMLERTLTEAAAAMIIEWGQEGNYFKEVLEIFVQVETKKIELQDGISRLANEIEKINKTLPEEYCFPKVNVTAFIS